MRTTLAAALICALALALAGLDATAAAAQTKYQFDIPAQSLAESLRAVGRQTGTNILFEPALVKGVTAQALKAQLTAAEAIARLLVGTALSAERAAADTVLVRRADSSGPQPSVAHPPATGVPAPVESLRLSQSAGDEAQAGSVPGVDKAGPLRGHVASAKSGASLPGALIRILETGQDVTTDGLGNFRIPKLAAGDYTVSIAYIGYAEKLWRIAVPGSGGDRVSEFALDQSAFDGEEVTVFGTRSSRALALNQQKTADNYTSVISSDMLGNFTGTTLSEALRRVEGVTFVRDSVTGDGTNIMIRGLNPEMNAVKLNGLNLPTSVGSFGGAQRAATLSNMLADSVGKITISKTLLPSQDSAGTGGLVEIETKAPLDRPHRYVNFSVENGRKGGDFGDDWLASGTLSGTFGEARNKGLSASLQYRKRRVQNVGYDVFGYSGLYLPLERDGTPSIVDPSQIDPRVPFPYNPGDDKTYVTDVSNNFTDVLSRTLAATLSGQWQIGEHTNLRVDLQRARNSTDTLARRSAVNAGITYQLMPVNQLNGEERQTLVWDGTALAVQYYDLLTGVVDLTDTASFEGHSDIGPLSLSYTLGRAHGASRIPNSTSVTLGFGGFFTNFPLDESFVDAAARDPVEQRVVTPLGTRSGRGYQVPLLTPAGLAFFNDSNTYQLTSGTLSEPTNRGFNDRGTAELSARYDLGGPHWRYIELGGNFERSKYASFASLRSISGCLADPCPNIGALGLQLTESNLSPIGISGEGLNLVSEQATRDLMARIPALADQGLLTIYPAIVDPRLKQQFTRENNLATYLQTRLDFGKLEIVGGARVAHVEVQAVNLSSPSLVLEDGSIDFAFQERFTQLLDQRAVGTDILPRVLANYRQTDNLVFRAGYYMSVARPAISDLSAQQSVSLILVPVFGPARNQPSLSISQGNPALKPAITHNFDLAMEWYDDRVGVVRLGGYYKVIKNLLESNRTQLSAVPGDAPLPDDPRFNSLPADLYVEKFQPTNAINDSYLWGLEMALEKQLTFLPRAWSGLGVMLNYTFSDSSKKQLYEWGGSPIVDANGNFVRDDFGQVERETVQVPLKNGAFDLQAHHSGSAGITYNKYGFDASLTFTCQARGLGGFAAHDQSYFLEPTQSLDLRVAKRIANRLGDFTVSFEGTDLLKGTDDPEIETSYGGERGSPKFFNSGGFIGGRELRFGVSASF